MTEYKLKPVCVVKNRPKVPKLACIYSSCCDSLRLMTRSSKRVTCSIPFAGLLFHIIYHHNMSNTLLLFFHDVQCMHYYT